MPVALYARVSTADKDQNPETQLRPLREHLLHLHGATNAGAFVDPASHLRRYGDYAVNVEDKPEPIDPRFDGPDERTDDNGVGSEASPRAPPYFPLFSWCHFGLYLDLTPSLLQR